MIWSRKGKRRIRQSNSVESFCGTVVASVVCVSIQVFLRRKFYSSQTKAHLAAALGGNQLICKEGDGDSVSVTFSTMNAEIWHNLETMKVEPGVVHETYLAPAFKENELVEVKDVGCPVSITFPVVKTEIQEELWDFTAMRDVPSEVTDEACVFSLEELGVIQDNRVCCATPQLNTDSQNKPHDSIDIEGSPSDCVFIGQEQYKQKPSYVTHPGETSLGSDTQSKCLSEEMNHAKQSGSQRRKKLHYCQFCAIVFPSYHSLLQHNCIQSRKEGLKCSICNECFFEKETLAIHVLVHSGTLSFSRWRKAVDM
ncbi:uncharacterized protein LOC111872444 isoform X2 [Cryptotermes secundus]|uniref:uncharacterized protein LOC111872444 isoform X2 n=1 Tax=Cryptotermes secundus TaxID=105785 RepID=UPI000CD7DA99|nr:uncharacterized protein LOC111872444 isoform X2 [Cryptotermes secundus]